MEHIFFSLFHLAVNKKKSFQNSLNRASQHILKIVKSKIEKLEVMLKKFTDIQKSTKKVIPPDDGLSDDSAVYITPTKWMNSSKLLSMLK